VSRKFIRIAFIAMLISVSIMCCAEASPVWNPTAFAGGDGSSARPFEINNVTQITYFRDTCNSGAAVTGVHFMVTGDIDLSSVTNWTPIRNFSGHFNGRGHTISNLTITSNGDLIGFFSGTASGGRIENVNLVSVNVSGNLNVGGLLGANDVGTVQNCSVSGTVRGNSGVGMLSGANYGGGVISNCTASGKVVATGSYVGGLVGSNYAVISNSAAYTIISGWSSVGGIAGENYTGAGNVLNCIASGRVIGTGSYVGGLIGRNYSESTMSGCLFDVQGTGRSDSSIGRTTAEMTSGNPGGLGGAWTYESGYYPQPDELVDSAFRNIRSISALFAVPLYLKAGDTSAKVTQAFTVPLTTADGTPITWSASPSGVLKIDTYGNATFYAPATQAVDLTATAGEYQKLFSLSVTGITEDDGGNTDKGSGGGCTTGSMMGLILVLLAGLSLMVKKHRN
jgi:hypothetical protein